MEIFMSNLAVFMKNILISYNKIFLYHDLDVLVILWFFFLFFTFSLIRITKNIYQIGMLASTKEEQRFELKSDGKKSKKNIFKYISYDTPTNKILFIRTVGALANILLIILFLFHLILFSISIFLYITNLKFINLRYIHYYLFSVENMYGIYGIAFSFVLALIISFVIYHIYIKTYFSELDKKVNESMISSVTESNLRSGKLLDVKDLKFNEVGMYDPFKYFDDAYTKNSLFLGLDDESNPIYYNKEVWNETNVQIVGKMGSGKGVLATTVFIQCYKNFNDFNIWFDPKNDEWAYSVFKNNADENEFFYIDLNRSACPQFNIFDGINSVELNELFVAGFGLGRSGSNADFYRIGDRKACRELANQFKDGEQVNIDVIMQKWSKLPARIKDDAKNFYGQLEELSELKCIQTNKGINLAELIESDKRGMLYITGSLRDENVVMLQKMLLLRLTQLIERRDRTHNIKHINIMLDEVRYLLSKNTLEMMGTIRDKKANIIYTHQSLGDLVGSSQDLEPNSTKSVMLDNVGLRWIYKLDIKESADWASDLTSETLKDVERRTLSLNDANVEMASKETSIFKQKSNYIESSVIQNLPKRCGVLIGLQGLPKLAYSSPVIVNKLEKITISAQSLRMKSKNATNIINNKISECHVEIEDSRDSQSGLKDFLSKIRKDVQADIIDNTSIEPLNHNHDEEI
jgi:hypothetical protein